MASVIFCGSIVDIPSRYACTLRNSQENNILALGWRDVDLRRPIERATGLPVEIENAANACALAELWFGGHGERARDLVVVTVSEGIGTGIILDGQLIVGPSGMAGEFGHVCLDEKGPICACGQSGCWETFASNSAAIRYWRQLHQGSSPPGGASEQEDGKPGFADLLRLADQGDVAAVQSLERMAHYLGTGIAMLVTGLAPSLVLVVGEVTRAWHRVGPIIERIVRQRSAIPTSSVVLPSNAELHPRLRGTLALVMRKYF